MKQRCLCVKFTKVLHFIIVIGVATLCSSWGFFAHNRINHHAVFSLPQGMIRFYKSNIDYIATHAIDPDKRRYVDSLEAPRHFLDVDRYGKAPFDSIPQKWEHAVAKYSVKSLAKNGLVPWHIEKTYKALVYAFQTKDSLQILRLSADLGHYVADAHVPLHTTENYNGQLTNQKGIHALWESRLPELFAGEYNYVVGIAKYINNPLDNTWKIIQHTFKQKDSVLLIEARLNKYFAADKKYEFSKRNDKLIKQYSQEYSRAYHRALNGMVENQMRLAIHKIASFWYSAWVDAGQPDLSGFKAPIVEPKKRIRAQKQVPICYKENCH